MRTYPVTAVRGILLRDGQLLVMERRRNNFHFFALPGGHIEDGESPEEALSRELFEETSLHCEVQQLAYEVTLHFRKETHLYYLVQSQDTTVPALQAGAGEQAQINEGQQYLPRWIALQELATLPCLPAPVFTRLQAEAKSGFLRTPQEIVVSAADDHVDSTTL